MVVFVRCLVVVIGKFLRYFLAILSGRVEQPRKNASDRKTKEAVTRGRRVVTREAGRVF
jgi:hypothetical protein